jgi:hypothetical protein
MVGYLASDSAWNINGQVFHVSGGNVSVGHHPIAMRTVWNDEVWSMSLLDDAVQSVLLRGIPNPAPPRDDVEVPGRDIDAKPLA